MPFAEISVSIVPIDLEEYSFVLFLKFRSFSLRSAGLIASSTYYYSMSQLVATFSSLQVRNVWRKFSIIIISALYLIKNYHILISLLPLKFSSHIRILLINLPFYPHLHYLKIEWVFCVKFSQFKGIYCALLMFSQHVQYLQCCLRM